MPDPEQERSEPPLHSRPAEVIREAKGFGKWLSSLSTAQFQAFALAGMTAFICGLAAFIIWKWEASQAQREAMQTRHAESQSELIRQHCTQEAKELREYFAARERERNAHELARDKERMRFEGEERKQDRETIKAAVTEYIKWREMLRPILKSPPEPAPAVAPLPHEKVIGQ